ncbi:DNA endonuclease SmrA [Catenovulum sp. SM1970]|uniref:DNA endonuclease SmrA n=1 Tax=Marinifaba aquimaris TaxID=2741323 RepID=UPI001571F890|nr:DNA endonuclease SmrA [Marinifaba aquimaris]NTS78423.1 DNA endonuclease SmrA [Marinifaba aquimaris]
MSDTQDEWALFQQEMADVKPLTQDKQNLTNKTEPSLAQQARKEAAEQELEDDPNNLSTEYIEPVDPFDVIEYKKSGVQEGVYRKLRLGQYQIDANLNLHHFSVREARRELFNFIQESYQKSIRSLLIVHGVGKDSKPYPAVLKSHVNKWLTEMDCVLAFHTAIKAHGGYGATYVLLRKSEEKKRENRERHLKRRA